MNDYVIHELKRNATRSRSKWRWNLTVKDKMAELNEHAINNEQYSKKSCASLFGIPEVEGRIAKVKQSNSSETFEIKS